MWRVGHLLLLMSIVFRITEEKSLGDAGSLEDSMFIQEQKLVEDDDLNKVESFLGFMKEDFLRKLNLSGVPQEHRKVQPPQFMIELYNRYASDKNSIPRSDVIRSFVVQDVIYSIRQGNKTQHRLLFNVSIPNHEEITSVQLRLFTLWHRHKPACDDLFTSINVYDVEYEQNAKILHLLDGRDVRESINTWEAFDVTGAVRIWHESRRGAGEIQVEVQHSCDSFDISLSLEDNSSAVVIVFSDDLGNRKEESMRKVKEMLVREQQQVGNQAPVSNRHRRRKRKAKNNYCRRTSLKVNFKDIGWDKWIVAPPEYDAYECKGVCYFPLTDDVSPSRHAVIQTLVNLSNPKKANMACCVPTKLDPIAVMYQEKGVITVRHLYEEMKVAKCGCR
ncbi:growth/differentiation factor 2 preproprotein [Danio rerio]|uniref:Growth/differentiation factor 2 n=1 Tax=Danio rerio TaxID=7955 RepID=GDF2_DANRE|nr:growth/differentiation factor 2 preproprotein [Danio rerio]F1QWZ4.1 RecName: Full=Growth/differentiation factor 2; Short=GDF-2; AltName: Full=Bone morphogenetic protein 9; Short=BMP-9; Flags: Precursor [Danio rerio]|eukprot:NP_001165057.2 growth/differentiation factor 2 preproprotein [Danio rerio]